MNAIKKLFSGLGTPISGLQFMQQNKSLWQYARIPIILNILITGICLYLMIQLVGSVGDSLDQRFSEGVIGTILKYAALVGVWIIAAVIVIAVWLLLQAILCSYFYGVLAQKTELLLGTPKEDLKELSVLYQIVDALRAMLVLILINVFLLLLNVVPGIGATIAIVATLYFDCFIFGYDYFDYALEMRGLRRKDKLKFVRTHRPATLGLGASAFALSLVPILGAFFLSTTVVGAVLLTRELIGKPRSSLPNQTT